MQETARATKVGVYSDPPLSAKNGLLHSWQANDECTEGPTIVERTQHPISVPNPWNVLRVFHETSFAWQSDGSSLISQ